MAGKIGELFVEITAKTTDLQNKLNTVNNQISGLEKQTVKTAGVMGGLWKQFAGGVIAANVLHQGIHFVVAELTSTITKAMETERVLTQLDAVLASTGGATGLTKDELVKMAKALQNVTIYSDETVMSAETMLLRFREISQDVFPQALEAATNVATALGKDLTSAAEQVGKALEDPITATRMLRSINILLNEEQKKTIKSLMETGQVAAAQKIILDELNTAYGNAAKAAGETYAGRLAILKNQYQELKEQIGAALLPVLKQLLETVIPIVKQLADWAEKNQAALTAGVKLIVNLEGLAASFMVLTKVLETSLWVYEKTVGQLEKLGTIGKGVKNSLLLLPAVLDMLADKTKKTGEVTGLWGAVLKTVPPVLLKEKDALDKTASATKKLTEKKKEVTDANIKLAGSAATTTGIFIKKLPAVRDLGDALTKFAPIVDEVAYRTEKMAEDVEVALTANQQAWLDFKNNVAQDIGEVVGEALKLPKVIDDWVETWPPILKGLFKTIYDSFLQFVKNLIAVWVTKFLTDTLIKKTADAAPSVIDGLKKITEGAAGAISGVATSAINTVANVVSAVTGVISLFKKADYSSITYWLKPISERLQEIHDYLFIVLEGQHLGHMHDIMVDDNKCMWDLVYKGQAIVDILTGGFGAVVDAIGKIKSYQGGGYVPQTQLAVVHKGEWVMPPEGMSGGGQAGPIAGGPVSVRANIPAIDLNAGIKQIILEIIPKLSEQGILQFHVRGLKYV